jgi:hypothetical protein
MTTNQGGTAQFVSMHLFAEKQAITTSNVPLIRFVAHYDPTGQQMLRLVETSGALDFWTDDSEDGYTVSDGEAI